MVKEKSQIINKNNDERNKSKGRNLSKDRDVSNDKEIRNVKRDLKLNLKKFDNKIELENNLKDEGQNQPNPIIKNPEIVKNEKNSYENIVNDYVKPLKENLISSTAKGVSVVARFRPLNEKEISISEDNCVKFLGNNTVELISTIENTNYKFSFDNIFSPDVSQQEVYQKSALPIVNSILEGFNGTILAYGQTSSGKTFTMQGDLDNEKTHGIIPRTIDDLFDAIMKSPDEIEFTVKVSYFEIYMEKIKDLVDTTRVNLNIREEKSLGIYVEDLSEYYVSSKEEIIEIMKIGAENRTQASTNMNLTSSRSHSIFTINIHQQNKKDGSAKNSKLVLVDLAGSEKISKTGATGLTLEEAKTINKSLTTLGMVINSLTDGKSTHVPYRESKLTRVLQESLGGNSKTSLIITCSPSIYNESETLSTLRFGNRAKNIKNKPKINKETTIGELQQLIDKLENKLNWAMNRIRCLESFIVSNNLEIPKDKNLGNYCELPEVINDINFTNTKIDSIEFKEVNIDTLDNEMSISQLKNENFLNTDFVDIDRKKSIKNIQVDENKFNSILEELNINQSNLNDEQLMLLNELLKVVQENDEILNRLKENEKLLQQKSNEIKKDIKNISEGNKMGRESMIIIAKNKQNKELNIENINLTPLKEIKEIENFDLINNLTESKEIVDKYVVELEILRKKLKQSENEKLFIIKALEDKSERLSEQEIEIKEFHDTIKILEGKINPQDREFVKKMIVLEKNAEQLKDMYTQIVTQKSVVKCENQILNKKIKQRNDRILLLEKEIGDLKESIKSKEYENKSVFNKVNLRSSNVVKIIKGHNKNTIQVDT